MTDEGLNRLAQPVVIYTARSNNDAQLLAALLRDAGIAAVAVDDMSPGGMFALGTLGYLHRPQVFVEKSEAEQAARFITDFEENGEPLDAGEFCYYCGAAVQAGANQCPECSRTLD